MLVENQRVDAQELEKMCGLMADAIFLTCRNYASRRKHVANCGMLGMLKQANIWNIICLHSIDIPKKILCAYKYVPGPTSVWSDPDDMLRRLTTFEISFNDIGINDLHWVNQCYGKVPFEPLTEDNVNDIDNKFQCPLKGLDYLPFFSWSMESKLLLVPPSHFKDPVPLYYKGPFQDLPLIHLQGMNVSGKKRKHLMSKRKSRFENTEVDVMTLYCEKTCHMKDRKSNDCGVMIGHVLYNVDINIFDNISKDLQCNIGVTKKDFYQFVKMNLNSTSHPYVIDMRNHQNGIRIKVVESTYFDSLPSTAKIY
jgi:hypothetical protein